MQQHLKKLKAELNALIAKTDLSEDRKKVIMNWLEDPNDLETPEDIDFIKYITNDIETASTINEILFLKKVASIKNGVEAADKYARLESMLNIENFPLPDSIVSNYALLTEFDAILMNRNIIDSNLRLQFNRSNQNKWILSGVYQIMMHTDIFNPDIMVHTKVDFLNERYGTGEMSYFYRKEKVNESIELAYKKLPEIELVLGIKVDY